MDDIRHLEANQYLGIYWREKKRRTIYYYRFIYGWIEVPCRACSGSGIYDNTGSPPCGGCNGTGKVKEPGPKWYSQPDYRKTGKST